MAVQLVHKAAALLEPVYEPQLASIRQSGVVAMDETPIKASSMSRGKTKTTYYWLLHGDKEEVRLRLVCLMGRAEREDAARQLRGQVALA